MQKNKLTEKVALVTGSARRIGAEIVRTLHEAGMKIVLHYNVSKEEAQALRDALNAVRPNSVVTLQADLDVPESEKQLIEKATAKWGRLDVLVNNASRFYRTHLGEVTEAAWHDLLNSNVKTPFFLAQAAWPALKATQGAIINIIDIHAERPMRDYAVYCIAKSGLLMMTKALAKEFSPEVRVNAVAPGAILWPEGENALSDKKKKRSSNKLYCSGQAMPQTLQKQFYILCVMQSM